MDVVAAWIAVARRTRAVAVAATVALIVLGVAWELWLAPTGSGTLAVKVLPLLVPLPGLLRLRLYTYRWLSLAIWIYAAEGAVRATSERGVSASLALAELALALVVFAACCVHVRARLRGAARATAP
jgi:uncharacterized membrane protein